MAPAELKKYRNKQRKARKRAELEKEKQNAAQEKREQHIKSRQQQDGEADGVKEEELVPEKLAKVRLPRTAPLVRGLVPYALRGSDSSENCRSRDLDSSESSRSRRSMTIVEDPLQQAIRFLKPMQALASERIDTHLLAFEIYIRKDKLLLMLQSVKRAWAIDCTNPQLHSNLVRFYNIVSQRKELAPAVKTVLIQEMSKIYGKKSASELNEEFLAKFSQSLPHLLQGARMKYCLDNLSQEEAINCVTNLNNQMKGVCLKTCTDILEALRNGDLGSCDTEVASFLAKCQELFPYAAIFRPQVKHNNIGPVPTTLSPQEYEVSSKNSESHLVSNHVDSLPKEEEQLGP